MPAALLSIRHILLPIAGLALVWFVPLTSVQRVVVAAFAAMPTASSCYVLAARLGGHASFVAGLVTVSTLLGMVSVPLALAAVRLLGL